MQQSRTVVRKLNSWGIFSLNNVTYLVDVHRAFEHVLVQQDDNTITVIDLNGEILLRTSHPTAGARHVGKTQGWRPPPPSPKS